MPIEWYERSSSDRRYKEGARRAKKSSKKMTRQEREVAQNIVSNVRTGKRRGWEDVVSATQVANAIKAREKAKAKAAKRAKSKSSQRRAAQLEKDRAKTQAKYDKQVQDFVKSGKTEINNVPVTVVDGKLVYDIQTMGQRIGMTPGQIEKAAAVQAKSSAIGTDDTLEDMLEVGGKVEKGSRKKGAEDAVSTAKRSLGNNPQVAILNNLAQLDPLKAQVNFDKEDHILNLSRAGSMWNRHEDDQRELLDRGQGPRGIGKYAAPAMKAAVGTMIGLATAGAGIPAMMAAGGAYGGLTGLQESGGKLSGALKGAATGAAAAGIGGGASKIASGLTSSMAQGLGKTATQGAIRGAITSAGQEGMGALLEGEKFNLGNVAKGAAISGASAAGSHLVSGALEGTGVGNALGIGEAPLEGDTLEAVQSAPTALEVGASPGDIGVAGSSAPIKVSGDQFANYQAMDLGYGAGNFGSTHSQIGPSMYQDPTGPARNATGGMEGESGFDFGGAQPGDTITRPTNWGAPEGVMSEPAGPGGIGGVGPVEGPLDMTKEWQPGRFMTPSEMDQRGYLDPEGTLKEGAFQQWDIDRFNETKPRFKTPEEMRQEGLITGDNVLTPGALSQNIPSKWEEPEMYKGPGAGDVLTALGGSALGAVAPIIAADLAGDSGRKPDLGSRQSEFTGSTASSYDPESELQRAGIGSLELNPALVSQGIEDVSEDEKKKRRAMWMNNPLITSINNDFGGEGSI